MVFTTVKNKDANFAKTAYNRLSNYTVTDIKGRYGIKDFE